MSLRSELSLVETLLKVSKNCLCPKLKTHADELYERSVKLKEELNIRLKEETLGVDHPTIVIRPTLAANE